MAEENKIGTIRIADSVVISIAGIAALEAEGVYRLAGNGNLTRDMVAKLGKKKLSGCVSAELNGRSVQVSVALEMEYGNSIKKVSEDVQSRIKQSIESMTGLEVTAVNVEVVGIKVKDE